MPLVDITNPRIINFLVESYAKENRICVRWNFKNEEKILQSTKLNREFKNNKDYDILESTMIAGMAATTNDHVTGARNKMTRMNRDGHYIPGFKDMKKGHSLVDVGLGTVEDDPRLGRPDNSLDPDPIMKPVDPKVTSLIYGTDPARCRRNYLDVREKVDPEKKYYLAECVNWDYGWRMKDSVMKQSIRRGRNCILTNSFKTNRVGPQPDPLHYKSSILPEVSKCIAE